MTVPFVDLKAQYLSLKNEIDNAIAEVIEQTSFIGGQQIKDFEKAFAAYVGTKFCIACGNGTDSIEMLLQAMGVSKGDEVIVPAMSWISTSEAVGNVGAVPVFVDVNDFYVINTSLIEEKITGKTKAIIPVHLYGHPADMPAIMAIAEKHNLKVLEDCAQSHGADVGGKRTGTWGHAASFSFYPGKNLGAYGDAGCMVTNDEAIASQVRQTANHGQLKKHTHLIEGRNSRMDTIHAAVLNAKLPHIEKWTEARIKNAAMYNNLLKGCKVAIPLVNNITRHVYHLYVIQSEKRNELQEYLSANGVQTFVHYPTSLPFLDCYKQRGFSQKDFPVAFDNQNKILSLPMYAEIEEEQINAVVKLIKSFEAK